MEPTTVTDRQDFRRTVRSAETGDRVPVEVRVTVSDPFLAYRRARDGDWTAYLETTGGSEGWGYFGVDPVETLTVADPAVNRENSSASLAALEAVVDGERLVRGDCTVPYPCGAIGWISYDVAREIEDLPDTTEDRRSLPRLQFAVYDRLATWEEPRDGEPRLQITACPRLEGSDPEDADRAYDRGRDRALELVDAIRDGTETVGPPPSPATTATFESESGRSDYEDRVRAVKDYVRDGDTFQANVSHRLVADAAVHPVEAYGALRAVNPAPYSGLVEFPGVDLVSASPELLLEMDDDWLRTEPIAGTRPRGASDEEDRALEAELLDDEKERAEHAMLVDLERNDLGKVCEYGSVVVDEYRRVDRYSEVMHLVSSVVGTRRDDASLADVVAALFPGGTITGAPKPRTMEIIDELETTRRGPYTGSIGIVGFDERATLSMTIRTMVQTGQEYGLRVGAGIVHDSVPEREYEETMDKARALLTAVDEALEAGTSLTVGGDDEQTVEEDAEP
jgi:anthranilate synthase component 1